MTKKDYELIAKVMRHAFENALDPETDAVVGSAVEKFSELLAADNPRFNKEVFETACGY